ncbi:MAG TPA: hypothetical protein DDW73_13990 [Rhizobium sp.]|jgi:hypothetical protein|nr:hypothetical protein [Rhizobium sp.]
MFLLQRLRLRLLMSGRSLSRVDACPDAKSRQMQNLDCYFLLELHGSIMRFIKDKPHAGGEDEDPVGTECG